MTTLVVDASVAVKWVVEESGTAEALRLRPRAKLMAPALLTAECANILWKKVRRLQLTPAAASVAARLLQLADVEIVPARFLLEPATRMAVELDHSAYDCLYLALAVERDCRLVTADEHFLRKIGRGPRRALRRHAMGLREAASGLDLPTPPR